MNDLDLEVTVTPVRGSGEQSLNASAREVDVRKATLYAGNAVVGGDRHNNVERVRVFALAGPAKVEATVRALRVAANAEPDGPDRCQSFALVITGALEESATTVGTEVATSPSPLPGGICGRLDAEEMEAAKGLNVPLVALAVGGASVGAVMAVCPCVCPCLCVALSMGELSRQRGCGSGAGEAMVRGSGEGWRVLRESGRGGRC